MIHITVGRAGTGKTYSIFGKIKELVENGAGNINLLVPDQFSFEAERIIVKLCGASASDKVQVFGFTRLCEEILRDFGGLKGSSINDAARAVLLKQAAISVKDELQVYSKICDRREFIPELLFTINELKQAAAELNSGENTAFQGVSNVLKAKLHDISVINDTYSALLQNTYIDTNDLPLSAYEKAKGAGWFKNKVFFIDSFSGFTGAQLKLLEVIIAEADDVFFSFTCDNDNFYSDDYSVFSVIKKEIRKIISISQKHGVPIDKTAVLTDLKLKRADLSALEAVISGDMCNDFTDKTDNIIVCHCATVYDEAEFTAREIRRLVREHGYRFRDFVIISGNENEYKQVIEDAMKRYNIPCFIDSRYEASRLILPSFVLSVLRCAAEPTSDNILKMLKTGLTGMKDEDICALENYVYIWGKSAGNWFDEWNMSPNGYEKTFESAESLGARLEKINTLRENALTYFSDLKELRFTTAERIVTKLYTVLKNNVKDKLAEFTDKLVSDGNLLLASAEEDSWELVMQAFDCMTLCFGDGKITVEEFLDSFEVYINNSSVGEPPQTLDEVMFGESGRIRPKYPKVAFLIGVNQGVFPNYSKSSGILSAHDRAKLIEIGVGIEDRSVDTAVMENFRFYSMASCMSERIYFTSADSSLSGACLDMPRVLRRITEKMPGISHKYESFNLALSEDNIEAELPAFERLTYSWDKNDVVVNSLKDIFLKDQEYSNKIRLLDAGASRATANISPQNASALYSNNLRLSASKVDDFYHCPFRFFCRYGMSLKKLQKAELSSIIRGTIVHDVLDMVISENKDRLGQLLREEIEEAVNTAAAKYFAGVNLTEDSLPAMVKYSLAATKAMLCDLINHINREFAQSEFRVDSCELSVSSKGPVKPLDVDLSNGKTITLTGSVDRVDICEINGKSFVRVIDYKTGGKNFKLCDTLVGLNLQMLIYLYAIVKGYGRELEPAGILYQRAKSGIPDAGKSLDSGFKANGLLVDDIDVLRMMERELSGEFIPAKMNTKTPTLSKRSQVVSSDAFKLVFYNINKILAKMGNSVFAGDISVDPLDGCDTEACRFCDFREICLRDEGIKNKSADEITNEETVEILKSRAGQAIM